MENESISSVTQVHFTNAVTGETVEIQALPEGSCALEGDKTMVLSWNSDGTAHLDLG
jgi:hypothetical protein